MSLVRYGVEAPHLPKRRRPSGREKEPAYTAAEVDEYNLRQLMRCVETRNRWSDKDRAYPGPPGIQSSTTVQWVEVAQRKLPPLELAAYMAKEQGTQEHQNMLVDAVEVQVRRLAGRQHWRYIQRPEKEDPIHILASIVVEEWLNPAKYWKLIKSEDAEDTPTQVRPVISVFARVMGCRRQTWRDNWHERFLALQGYPQPVYELGKILIEGSL